MRGTIPLAAAVFTDSAVRQAVADGRLAVNDGVLLTADADRVEARTQAGRLWGRLGG